MAGKVTLYRVVGHGPKVTPAQVVATESPPPPAHGAQSREPLVQHSPNHPVLPRAARTGLAEGRRGKEELWQVAMLTQEQRAINCLN